MTKNGDLPAIPMEFSGFGQFAPEAYIGLTKRERFAMAAMQGLCATGQYGGFNHAAQDAVKAADELLAALEGSKS